MTVTTEPPEPVGLVDGPVGSVAGPVGEVITLVPGVKVTVVEKPGPVIVSTVDSVTVTVTTEPPGPVGLVDGPVGSVAGPVGEVMTLVPGVKVTVVEKPGPVMVSTVDSVTVTVTTEPPGPVGLVDGPVGSVAGPVGVVLDSESDGLVAGPVGVVITLVPELK